TPELDRLASEGIVMDDFQAVAPITGPAHATLLTGMWPPSHGLRANGHRAPTLTTPRLPEILRDRGWHTGGFVSALPVFAKFGFDRGFEHFDDRGESTPLDQILQVIRFGSSVARLVLPDLRGTFSVPGQITVDRALDWMGEVDGPTFTWLHLFDAHGPFLPPEPYRARALARAGEGAAAFDPQDQDDWIMQRGEIELLDDLLGQVRRGLEERDPGLKNTLLVVVSDHGECFGEGGIHGEHEPSLYAATQRIPAVLKFPDALAGRVPFALGRRSALSSQVDVAPTLLAALGIAVPPTYQGVDMFAVEVSARSGVYMEAFQERLGEERLHGWVSGEWKYTRRLGGVETLWRRGKELENLATKHPDVLARMREALDKFLAETPIREAGAVDLSDADMQAMEALGYADSADD
ncbi:MAG: sulfatase, partial [Planctomycetes bacterium]|nr:sulfatase [Planctomycetota bacterium]